jgi:organic radical activating enzyme
MNTGLAESHPRIEPRYLVIHLTYRCPARCDHCCFSSDIYKKGHMPLDYVLLSISQAAEIQSIGLVGFTGGEPFLHPAILREASRHAHDLRLRTGVVTSAYWARSEKRAMTILQPLAEAGLNELMVSYDDSHAPFIPEPNIVNAFRAASALGVKLSLNVCLEPDSRIDRRYIERMLGLEEGQTQVEIQESWINSTGRARNEASAERQRRRKGGLEVRLGPCHLILRGPALTPTGKILACCGTISYKEGLVIGDISTETLLEALNRAYENPLLKWIAFEGPGAVLERITEGTPSPITASDLDGNCHACELLFSNPAYLALAQAVVEGPRKRFLELQELTWSLLGMFRPPSNASGSEFRLIPADMSGGSRVEVIDGGILREGTRESRL